MLRVVSGSAGWRHRRVSVMLAVALLAGGAGVGRGDDPLPGIVFVGGDILGPQHEMDGHLATYHWREGYIYHRATTLHPLERTMTPTRPGRNLYTLIPARPDGVLKRITHLTEGQVFDPEVSWDGRKILFSMRRDGEDWFHLCQINADGTGSVQLTDGPFNDVSGVYLPDGRIVFVSDRAGYLEEYHEERTETLWIMNGDGTGMQPLTFNPGTVFDPSVLADGRICYSYWDDFMIDVPPLDKHETYLMTVRPDGTEDGPLFGMRQYRFFNRERHSGSSLNQAYQRADGTLLALSEVGPVLIDLRRGPDMAESLWPVFPGTTSIQLGGATHRVHLSPIGSRITPCPLPDGRFLFSATLPGERDLAIYVCDPRTRQTQLVFNDPQHAEYDARPILLARPRPAVMTDKNRATGSSGLFQAEVGRRRRGAAPHAPSDALVPVTGRARFIVSAARRSDNPEHERVLERTRYFRVIETRPTAVTTSSHTNLETRILGVVPIHDDGSVYFEGPADTPLFLEALDAAGNRLLFNWNYPVTSVPVGSKQVLVEMSTFTARAGEVKACHGCHAGAGEAPSSGRLAALAHDPVQLERDLTDILYRRNEPDEYRCQARVGEAARYRPWLSGRHARLRRQACEMLMAIEDGARQDAPRIARLLDDPAVAVRRASALALGRLGTLDQSPALLAALDDPDWQVRMYAACALEAVTACRPAPGGEQSARHFYRQLFARTGGTEGVRKLLAQGPDAVARCSLGGQTEVAGRWFEAIGRLGKSAPNSVRQVVRRALAVAQPPPSKFQPSVGQQHHVLEGPAADPAAIRAAGWIGDDRLVPLLVPWLTRHDYRYHAAEAALALGRIGSPEAIQALWQAVHSEVPNRRVYIGRYLQHGPRPEEYALLRALIIAGAAPRLDDVPLIIAMLPGTFLEKPRFEDRLRPESQRVLLGRRLLEMGGFRSRAVKLLAAGLKGDPAARDDPLYEQLLKGINLERPFREHGRPFPVVKRIEPEQALWLLGCLAIDAAEIPEEQIVARLTSRNHRERIDAAVLLGLLAVSPRAADVLEAEIAKPYGFREIMSIGKGRLDPNFRDKCYMVAALARHVDDVSRLRPFADPRARYRDIRYGLAVGLGYRGKLDGLPLLIELATGDPIAVVRRQARESLRAIQELQLQAGRPLPRIELPRAKPYEALYPPRSLEWPAPVAIEHGQHERAESRGFDKLKAAIQAGLDAHNYRNLNNVNNQAPGAKRMMMRGMHPFARAVDQLTRRFPDRAGPILRRLLDSPYPFAHYLALKALCRGGFAELDDVLIANLDRCAKSADTVGFYWTCEALAHRRVRRALPALARHARIDSRGGIFGPLGMGIGYPAAKAVASLAGRADHPQVQRLLASGNPWLRAGVLAGLATADDPRADALLEQAARHSPTALVRSEAALALRNRSAAHLGRWTALERAD